MTKDEESGGVRELKERMATLRLGSPKKKKSFRGTHLASIAKTSSMMLLGCLLAHFRGRGWDALWQTYCEGKLLLGLVVAGHDCLAHVLDFFVVLFLVASVDVVAVGGGVVEADAVVVVGSPRRRTSHGVDPAAPPVIGLAGSTCLPDGRRNWGEVYVVGEGSQHS